VLEAIISLNVSNFYFIVLFHVLLYLVILYYVINNSNFISCLLFVGNRKRLNFGLCNKIYSVRVRLALWARKLKLRNNKSPLPLTDPRDAKAQRMLNTPYRNIW